MTIKFTELYIRNLKPEGRSYERRESGGFLIRVLPSGIRTWQFKYAYLGTRQTLTLGTYPKVSLQDARKAFQDARGLLAQGINPAEQKRLNIEARKAERREPTVADLVEEFLAQYTKPKPRTRQEYARILKKDVIPALGKRKVKDVACRDVVLLVDRVAKRGGIMGNQTLACVRRMFNFAVARGLLDASPVAPIKAPAPAVRRDRILSPDEIKAFWMALDAAPMSHYLRLALKLLLATGQRKGEVITARWADVDIDSGWWTIPATYAKNGHLHRVPLNSTALSLLRALRALHLPAPCLFPSPLNGGRNPIRHTSLDHALRRCEFGLDPFTPHDLRRTVGTALGERGFNRLVQDKVLNHIDRTVGGIYDRHSYDKEKRQALEAWDRRLQAILTGQSADNVIPLRPATV